VEVERVAPLVGLRVVRALVADAGGAELVAAELVLGQLREQVVEGVVADAAQALRRELEATLLGLDEAGLLELLGQLRELLERAGGVVTE
jgi:hypothetical protein